MTEETASVSKRRVTTGKVRIQTLSEEREENVSASLESDAVEVTRVPVDRVVDTVPAIRTEGNVTIIPIMEEVMVVEKKLVLKEELHIVRRKETETVDVPITLRRQRVVVENVDAAGTPILEEG